MALQKRRYTVEEYLEIDNAALDEKYEYRDGEIVNIRELIAMAGSSINHSAITVNTINAISNRLKGGPCRVFDSNLRITIPRKTLYYYPDASVICGPVERDSRDKSGYTATNPRVIVEVLSPGTELFDRGDKFTRYREIEMLEEYVLISQHEPRVETYFRQSDGTWLFAAAAGVEASAKLRSLRVDLPLAEVFADVEWAAA